MQTIKRLFTYFFNGYSEYFCIRDAPQDLSSV
jgi:hypothetical protein